MKESFAVRLVSLVCLISFVGRPLCAADVVSGNDKSSGKLVVRRVFEDLSDKARTSLRNLTDECLVEVAVLPKAAKTEWCLDQLQRKYPIQQNMGWNQESTLRMWNNQLAQCSSSYNAPTSNAVVREASNQDNGPTKEQRIQQCRDRIEQQIHQYKDSIRDREVAQQAEKDQCKANPDTALETRCHAFEDAFRNSIDRQINP